MAGKVIDSVPDLPSFYRQQSSELLLKDLVQKEAIKNGYILDSAEDFEWVAQQSLRKGQSLFFNYMIGWVARGAWIGGAFGLGIKACEYLAQPQGESLQATYDEGPSVRVGTRSIGSAANSAVSFLYAGDLEHAR